jgi:molecular chaperone GrpE
MTEKEDKKTLDNAHNHEEVSEEAPVASEPETLKIAKLEEELKESKDKYLRLLAEMENSRKRMQKEKQESTRFAVESSLGEILVPMDNLENALGFVQNMSEETRNWAKGFQMILSQFKDALSRNGVTAFTSEGAPFDPHKHEAIETEETDKVPEGTILKEFVRGYSCGDRILRPARVKVAKSPSKEKEKQ